MKLYPLALAMIIRAVGVIPGEVRTSTILTARTASRGSPRPSASAKGMLRRG
jgi:hypothetical protein